MNKKLIYKTKREKADPDGSYWIGRTAESIKTRDVRDQVFSVAIQSWSI